MHDGAEVIRHQILGLGHESLVQLRHSLVRPTLGVWEMGDCGVHSDDQRGREECRCVLPLDLTAVNRT